VRTKQLPIKRVTAKGVRRMSVETYAVLTGTDRVRCYRMIERGELTALRYGRGMVIEARVAERVLGRVVTDAEIAEAARMAKAQRNKSPSNTYEGIPAQDWAESLVSVLKGLQEDKASGKLFTRQQVLALIEDALGRRDSEWLRRVKTLSSEMSTRLSAQAMPDEARAIIPPTALIPTREYDDDGLPTDDELDYFTLKKAQEATHG
jgi:hypothetical protein